MKFGSNPANLTFGANAVLWVVEEDEMCVIAFIASKNTFEIHKSGDKRHYHTDSLELLKLFLLDNIEGLPMQEADEMLNKFYSDIEVTHPNFRDTLGIEV